MNESNFSKSLTVSLESKNNFLVPVVNSANKMLIGTSKTSGEIYATNPDAFRFYRGGHKSLYPVQIIIIELGKVTYGHPCIPINYIVFLFFKRGLVMPTTH